MKYSLWRGHKARPAEYEALDMGARVEVDTEVDEEYAGMSTREIGKAMSRELDVLLDQEVNQALDLGGEMERSHVWDYYVEN